LRGTTEEIGLCACPVRTTSALAAATCSKQEEAAARRRSDASDRCRNPNRGAGNGGRHADMGGMM
jgi:hypothetical protein